MLVQAVAASNPLQRLSIGRKIILGVLQIPKENDVSSLAKQQSDLSFDCFITLFILWSLRVWGKASSVLYRRIEMRFENIWNSWKSFGQQYYGIGLKVQKVSAYLISFISIEMNYLVMWAHAFERVQAT